MVPAKGYVCPDCGRACTTADGGGTCAYCLLRLGLSGDGVVSTAGATRAASRSGDAASSAADRLVRQGVLPHFGDYELEMEIARGGMGVVYRARQLSLNRVVAVKLILAGQLATPESVQRFRNEAEAAAGLHHPGIVQIYEIGEIETQHFFSMELVDGASLAECLEAFCLQKDAAPAAKRQQELCIAELMAQVARALDFAHRRGVLHRDLKPSNILIDQEGKPRLTDFGLAKLTGRESSGLTLSTAVLGTPGYLAPEQAAGRTDQVTTAADVYGLGATLYELLTGGPPFVGGTALETMWMARERPVTPPRQFNRAIHPDLETITLRCLEKAPERRYTSAAAVADELDRFMRQEPIIARPVGRLERLWRWCQRKPALAGLLLALAVTIVAGSVAALWQWRQAERARAAAVTAQGTAERAKIATEQANITLRQTVSDLQWSAIDDMLNRGQSARALATVAGLLRSNPKDREAAAFAMSMVEQRRFAVPAAPPVRHPGGVELAVARLSPDGRCIVTASFDGTARIWDAATSEPIAPPLLHEAAVTWAEFSPDGRTLATCSEDKTARLWDTATGRARGEPVRHAEAVVRIQFSRDGRHLLTRTHHAVCIIDAASGQLLTPPILHEGSVVAARFLGDSTRFFTAQSAGEASRVRVWDLQDLKEAKGVTPRLELRTGALRAAELADDMARVAVIDSGGTGWLADFPSGARRIAVPSDNGALDQICFSPKGDRLAAVGHNHWARVWDAQTALPLTADLPHYYLLGGAVFLNDGERVLTWGSDALAQVWDVNAAGKPFCEPMRHVHRVIHAEAGTQGGAPDGGEVFLVTLSHLKSRTADSRTGAAQLWRVQIPQNPTSRFFGNDPGGFDGAVLSPDGRWIALAKTSQEIWVLDRASGAVICGPLRVNGGAWGLLFSPDASRLISTTSRGQVSVWSIPSGQRLAEPVELHTTIQPAELSDDGRRFVTGSTDGMVRLWDAATGRVVHEMRHGSEINSVAFSPDGRLVASAGEDRVTRLWDTATGRLVRELIGHQNEVMAVFFSRDGARVVTASLDFTARTWETGTGRPILTLPHQGEVLDACFSPDGKYIATASRDRTALVWDAATGQPHSHHLLHEQAVRNVRFSPDGRRVATMDFRGLRLWDVATGHPLTVPLRQNLFGGTGFQGSAGHFHFTPDGQAALVGGDAYEARIWQFPTPPTSVPAPPWFPDFLEAIAGQRFARGADRPEWVEPQTFLALRTRLMQSTDTDAYTLWARRWLSGPVPAVKGAAR